jgi:hypothetical protein
MLLDVLDAAQQQQVRGLQELAPRGQLVGGGQQIARLARIRPPGRVGDQPRPFGPRGRFAQPQDLARNSIEDQQRQNRQTDPEHVFHVGRDDLQRLADPAQPLGDLGRREQGAVELEAVVARQALVRPGDRVAGRFV